MEVLVTYDVNTTTKDGRRRLRRVAKICEGFGQRIQLSVFECVVNAMQLAQLRNVLEQEIDIAQDSLRIYRLQEPHERYVQCIGRRLPYDIHDPLVF
ncbi:MAG: CRISPR-associated endonuclease Cas2 [Chloroflexales bacterium]|nr:CRISPR-associated endonuclease Cas2 [Chloroflexales bacterium]